jgi:serine/threonine-protein kinase
VSGPPDASREEERLLPAGWAELAPLIDAVLDAAPDRRASLIRELCPADPARQEALTRLVDDCERDTPLLERPAAERFDGLVTDPSDSLLPDLLGGRYRTGRELGRGGMARVYLARDEKLGRDVAIKVLRPELSASLGHDRFLREIEIAARLRHPNIVPVHDSGEVGGALYFVMPFEEGPSLRERLAEQGALPISESINVLRDVARALAYAHDHGVVHRDVKPDNVMLSGGAAVVTDFGIAKAVSAALREASGPTLTQSGSSIGTPAYMAPEQATGDPSIDHRADIYSFGCLAYELFAGKPPFHSLSMHLIFAAHITTVPPRVTDVRVEVPPGVAALVARCLEKDPAARPQTAREVLETLDGPAATGSGATPPITATRRPARARAWVGGALALALIGTAAYVWTRTPAAAVPITLAVLPFGNIGADSTIDFVADALPDEVATVLARVPGIEIKSRNGARAYRGQLTVDVAEAGGRLKADYLLTGMVREDRGRWILSTEVTRAADATSLWGDRFNVSPDQQAGIAEAIAASLTAELRGRFPKVIGSSPDVATSRRASNPEAYRLYLIGKQQLNRRSRSVASSIPLFREAIGLDTLSAQAYSGLSLSLALSPRMQDLSPVPFIAEATAAARRALLLDPKLSEPHVALAMLAEYALQWDLAESEYKTALELDRHDVEARIQYGHHLRIRSRMAEALKQYQLAREDDPASAVVAGHLSYTWFLQGQMDSALAESARAQQIDPTNLIAAGQRARVFLAAGRPEEARRVIGNMPPSNGMAMYVLGKLGERDSMLERLRILENTRPTPGLVNTTRVFAMFALGDTARGLDALERATDAKEMWFWGLRSQGILDGVRENARFQAILRRVGLDR